MGSTIQPGLSNGAAPAVHTRGIQVHPVTCAIGAELRHVSLAEASRDAGLAAEIRALLVQHKVLFFRQQELTRAEHVSFARHFGELEDHPVIGSDPEHPGLVRIYKNPETPVDRYENSWHTDATWREKPPFGCVLRCVECPPVGGDTMWANLYLALETLTPPIRRLIEDLEALHDVTLVRGIEQRDPTVVAEMKKRNPPVIHPVVRTHPETGRKSLLVNQRIRRFLGMSDEESQNLLAMLNAHATSPEFVYRHRWSVGDVVMWDNRCSMHVALGDFDQTKPRVMFRCSLEGEVETGRIARDLAGSDRESMLQAVAAVS